MEKIELLSEDKLKVEKRKLFIIRCARYLEKKFEWMPVFKNHICFVTSTRKYYADNMKFVISELKKQNIRKRKYYWITRYPANCKKAIYDGVKVIKYRSVKHFWIQFFCKIIVCDDVMYPGIIKRKKQTYINVWHGGINYKGVGFNSILFLSDVQQKIYELSNPEPDYMVAGCGAFIGYIQSTFGFNNTCFLKTGLPRNDIFFSDYKDKSMRVKKAIGCEGKKIVCYMPTFRSNKKALSDNMFSPDEVIKALTNRFGSEWVFTYRMHYFDENAQKIEGIDVTEFEDVSELLCAIDVLISDYSSCMWDFEVLEKLCISYATDIDEFEQNDRGLTEQGKNMPYPKAGSAKELIELIYKVNLVEYINKIREHKKKMCCYEQGDASKTVADIIQRQG